MCVANAGTPPVADRVTNGASAPDVGVRVQVPGTAPTDWVVEPKDHASPVVEPVKVVRVRAPAGWAVGPLALAVDSDPVLTRATESPSVPAARTAILDRARMWVNPPVAGVGLDGPTRGAASAARWGLQRRLRERCGTIEGKSWNDSGFHASVTRVTRTLHGG